MSDPVATLERVCFLEWRIEQLTYALEDKERLLQQQRVQLAESAQREADAANRVSELERLLADARREAVLLGDRRDLQLDLEERLGQSERVNLHAARLVRELEQERERLSSAHRALEFARERITILESGRERFFAKLIQWQSLGQDKSGADLAQFISELRAEVSRLSSENATLADREGDLLREIQLLRAQEDRLAEGEAIGRPVVAQASILQPVATELGAAPIEACEGLESEADSPLHASRSEELENALIEARISDLEPELEAMQLEAASEAEARPADDPARSERTDESTSSSIEEVAASEAAPAPPPPPLSFAEVRTQLRSGLGSTSRARNAERLLLELFGANAALRRGAARALLHLAGEHAAPALVLSFHAATDAEERVELLALMARSGAPHVRTAIESAQTELDPRVRAAALDALALHARRDPRVLRAPLERALGDREARVRRRAVMVLCSLPRFDATDLLARVLEDPDPQLRRAACAGLAQVRRPHIQRLLAGALLDPELAVRKAAAAALQPTFGDEVMRIAERSEAQRRRHVALLRERIALRGSKEHDPLRPLATRLFDAEARSTRGTERLLRPGTRARRSVSAVSPRESVSE